MLTYQQGDLFDPANKVIAHGCNCVGLMGAGVARLVRQKHEVAYEKYKRAVEAGVFNLGYAQFVLDQVNDRAIYNLGTQRSPGSDATEWGIFLSFSNMLEHAKAHGIRSIAIPKIGAGIGGLDWENDVLPAIMEAEQRSQSTISLVVCCL